MFRNLYFYIFANMPFLIFSNIKISFPLVLPFYDISQTAPDKLNLESEFRIPGYGSKTSNF